MKDIESSLFTKGKMTPTNIAIAILIGIGLIVAANLFFGSGGSGEEHDGLAQYEPVAEPRGQEPGVTAQGFEPRTARPGPMTHEEMLERRLEGILRTVEGVGNTRVMITLAAGTHRVYAENVVRSESSTNEVDSAGGRRDQRDISGQQTMLTITRDGNQEPVLIRQYEPVVEGVIISAQGAGDARVRAELSAAAQTVLGVEEHQVQVLRMISGGR